MAISRRYAVQSQSLQAAIDQMSDDPAPFDLLEELALFRLTVNDVVIVYDQARESGNLEQVIGAGAALRRVMKELAGFVKMAQDVRVQQVLTVNTVASILATFEQVLMSQFPGDPRVEHILQELPSMMQIETAVGTNKTPADWDDEAMCMDSTIPAV